jgi:hypothetical protein
MRISAHELALWSFMMSSAHGAALMLVPILIGQSGGHSHADTVLSNTSIAMKVTAVVVHCTAMLLAMGFVAVIVYEKLGLGVLRRAWLNLDRV